MKSRNNEKKIQAYQFFETKKDSEINCQFTLHLNSNTRPKKLWLLLLSLSSVLLFILTLKFNNNESNLNQKFLWGKHESLSEQTEIQEQPFNISELAYRKQYQKKSKGNVIRENKECKTVPFNRCNKKK